MTSLWIDTQQGPASGTDELQAGARYDVVVVGAGLTGLATALLLARAGMSVAVLEARSIGAVTTGNTTGKVSLLQGRVLSGIRSHASDAVLHAYVEGNLEGQQWLLRYLADHGVEAQRRAAWSYATTTDGVGAVDEEFAASRAAGLDVVRVGQADLPFATTAAIRLPNQAQINSMDALSALARDVRAHGGVIVEGARVGTVDAGEPSRVVTSRGEVLATRVVVATGTPILDRGLHFATLTASRSYAMAFRLPDAGAQLPRGMYLSLDAPSRSLRTAPVGGEERLVVGGNGHPVGRHAPDMDPFGELEAWTARHFPGARRTHAWAAQDYRAVNRLPFTGWMPRSDEKIAVATGYDKWGLTNSIAAALSLSEQLLGGHIAWADTLREHNTTARDVASAVSANAEVGAHLAGGWVGAELRPLPDEPPAEGTGVVGNHRMRPTAVSTVGGLSCRLSAVCTHLGGVVSWNPVERSWDCPLHGSRFDAGGAVLEGPATSDLRAAE